MEREYLQQIIDLKMYGSLKTMKETIERQLRCSHIDDYQELQLEHDLDLIDEALEEEQKETIMEQLKKFNLDFSVMRLTITVQAENKKKAAEIALKIMRGNNSKFTNGDKEDGLEWSILRIKEEK